SCTTSCMQTVMYRFSTSYTAKTSSNGCASKAKRIHCSSMRVMALEVGVDERPGQYRREVFGRADRLENRLAVALQIRSRVTDPFPRLLLRHQHERLSSTIRPEPARAYWGRARTRRRRDEIRHVYGVLAARCDARALP